MMDPDLKLKYERCILIGITLTLFGFLLLYMSLRSENPNPIVLGIIFGLLLVMGMIWICRFIFWWEDL